MDLSIKVRHEEAATLLVVMDLVRFQVTSIFKKEHGMIKSRKMIVTYKNIYKTVKEELESNENAINVTLQLNSSQFEMLSEFVKSMIELFKEERLHDTWHAALKNINYEILQATIDNADLAVYQS